MASWQRGAHAGVAQWLEFQPSKLAMRVRFPSPAPLTASAYPSGRAVYTIDGRADYVDDASMSRCTCGANHPR